MVGNEVWNAAQCVLKKGNKLNNEVIIGTNSFVNKEIT